MSIENDENEKALTSPRQVARSLRRIFQREFGGKAAGRYRLDPGRLRKLAGREHLRLSFLRDVNEFLLERGFVLTNAGDFFVVQRVVQLEKAIRQVPYAIIRELS